MALYEYLCSKCGTRFEKRMPMAKVRQRTTCPKCKKQADKLMSTFAVTGIADDSFDFDMSDPDPSEMAGTGDGGHSHGHDHSHSHGSDDFDL